jgi:hypothetical protein
MRFDLKKLSNIFLNVGAAVFLTGSVYNFFVLQPALKTAPHLPQKISGEVVPYTQHDKTVYITKEFEQVADLQESAMILGGILIVVGMYLHWPLGNSRKKIYERRMQERERLDDDSKNG